MGFSWGFHVVRMELVLDSREVLNGTHVAFPWWFNGNSHGSSMMLRWDFGGTFIVVLPWGFHGAPMGRKSAPMIWDSNETPAVVALDFHGTFMGFPWDFHGSAV